MPWKTKIDLIGQRFGKLVVIESAETDKNGKAMWKCRCDCGNEEFITMGNSLVNGKTTSCGCSRINDLVGQRFGKLVVIGIAGKDNYNKYMWKCECDCGNEEFVTKGKSLVCGDTKSCGCERELKLIGQRFGKLIVIERAEKDGYNRYLWKCKCDCGTEEFIVNSQSLMKGRTISCGCVLEERKLEFGESAFNKLWREYNKNARDRGLDFLLSKEYFKIMTKEKCFYCGKDPEQKIGASGNNGFYMYNGIDRIDSELGYILGNVVPCCGKCNFRKSKMTMNNFLLWVKKVYEYSVLPMVQI